MLELGLGIVIGGSALIVLLLVAFLLILNKYKRYQYRKEMKARVRSLITERSHEEEKKIANKIIEEAPVVPQPVPKPVPK